MSDGTTHIDGNMDSAAIAPPFGKGAIVLTPTNYICRVNYVNLIAQVPVASVEYLEMHGAYSTYPLSELKLIADGAERPKFDIVMAQKHTYEREERLQQQLQQEEFLKNKKVTKTNKVDSKEKDLIKMLNKLSPEQLSKLLEEL